MGGGENKHSMSFHHHHDHHLMNKEGSSKGVPKGCMVVMVGHEGEEQLERFVIPIVYINHPLFLRLLKDAEEEYGFDHKGPITIPCHVDKFRHVQALIDRDYHRYHLHQDHNRQDHDQNNHHFLCFKN